MNSNIKGAGSAEAAAPGGLFQGKLRLRIVHTVSSLKVGGMEHSVVRLAGAQQSHGHRVAVLALQGGELFDQAARLGLHVRVLGGTRKIPRVLRGAFTMARLRPDIVHAHNRTSLHYALLAKTVGDPRVVITCHGRWRAGTRVPSRWEWRHTDAVVAVSQQTASQMGIPEIAGKLSVIRNGVDLGNVPRGREEVRADLDLPEGIVGIIVARMDRLKGHDTLLRALALLRDNRAPITLLVVGDGAERADLEGLARKLELRPERLRFLGFRPDVPDLLAASDFFVLPSLTEGLPLSILEAMAHRLPIVATPVGGIPELVLDKENGILVPVSDARALAKAMAMLANDSGLRASLGQAAYQHARDNFTFARMMAAYEELYCRLLLKPPRGLLEKSMQGKTQ